MENTRFTVSDSEKLKGIAVLLMLMHHLFLDKSVIESYGVLFPLISADKIRNISWFGKECVAIFAFISAYGITLSYLKNKGNKKWFAQRFICLYQGYWFVYILAFVISVITNRIPYRCLNPFQATVYGVIDFFGLNNVFRTPSLNGAWWYMEIAIEILVLVPIADMIYEKIGGMATLILTIAVPKVLGVNYVQLPADGNNSFIAFFMVIMLGIACAKYKLLEKIIGYINSKKLILKIGLFIVNTLLLYCGYKLYITIPVNQFYDINYGLTPFVLIIWMRLYFINIAVIKQIFSFIGKHSMNIFLVHIFIRSTYAQDFTFGFKYWGFILLFLLLSSIVLSFLIEKIKKIVKYEKLMEGLCKNICKVVERE